MRKIDYREQIEKAIVYIEQNLKCDISNSALSAIAGYSEYHFLRIFRDTVSLTPADYIRKRRITEIVREMLESKRPISDIAFEYGFNSKENFTRAFKSEHGILPTEFKAAKNSLKLYAPKMFDSPEFELVTEIITLPPFTIVAYKSDEPTPPKFWNKYNAKGCSKRLSGGKIVEDFGVCRWNHVEHKLDYYIGIPYEHANGDISGTETLDIPGGMYALFWTPPSALLDFVNTIHLTWDYINNVWIHKSGYQRLDSYEFESYIEQSRAFMEKIYIPITKKGN